MLRMPQPYPKQHEIYQHKGLPPSLYPQHMGDVRYNFDFSAWPRRHFVPDNRVIIHFIIYSIDINTFISYELLTQIN